MQFYCDDYFTTPEMAAPRRFFATTGQSFTRDGVAHSEDTTLAARNALLNMIEYLVAERGQRQTWMYLGGSIGGGTWAYERASGVDELLTYRSWRAVLGLEMGPPRLLPGAPGPGGATIEAEVGYVFGRSFQFDSGVPDMEPDNTLLLRAGVRF